MIYVNIASGTKRYLWTLNTSSDICGLSQRPISIYGIRFKNTAAFGQSLWSLPGWWAALRPLMLWWVCTRPGELVVVDLRDGNRGSSSLFLHKAHSLYPKLNSIVTKKVISCELIWNMAANIRELCLLYVEINKDSSKMNKSVKQQIQIIL